MHFILCDWKCLIACQGWLRVVECGVFSPFLWFPEGGGTLRNLKMQGKHLYVMECGFPWETLCIQAMNGIKSSRMDRGKKVGAVYEKGRGRRKGVGTEGPISLFFWSNDSWFCPYSHDKMLEYLSLRPLEKMVSWSPSPQTSVRWSADIIRHMEKIHQISGKTKIMFFDILMKDFCIYFHYWLPSNNYVKHLLCRLKHSCSGRSGTICLFCCLCKMFIEIKDPLCY